MYEDINEMLDGDIDVTKKYYNQVGRFYDMYHNTLVKLNHLEASLVDDEPGPLNIPDSAVEYNGHYYYLCCNNEAEDYATAENYCKEQGGYLATITSEKENKFLFNYVRKKGYSSAYFGLNNLKDGKAYQWNNGELLIYTKWAKNEPDNTFSDYGYYVRFNENAKDATWKVDTFSGGETNFNNVFLCEWGDYSVTGNDGLKVTSKKRDIVLTLDISASMDGIPLDETKKAAAKFVDSILNKNSNIGFVSYSDEATSLSGICSNDVFLKNTITSLSSAENTNIEDGLSRAYSMLQLGQSKKKLIVLMSDGLPTLGKDGEELIKYAEKIKDQGVLIYTLGFFQNTEEYKAEGQYLMEKIASEGCHYEVSSSEDLVFFFEDVAGQIGGQKYIYVKVACPVDVSVTYKGETLSSAENDQNLRTSFGTLSFRENEGKENNEEESSGYSKTYLKEADSKVKILRLKEGTDYNIKINGTGDGEMDYTIGFVNDEGEYNDLRRFEDIDINKDTVIDTVANTSKKTLLNIDEDGDGKLDIVSTTRTHTYEVTYTYEIYTEEYVPYYEGDLDTGDIVGSQYYREYIRNYSNYIPEDVPSKLDFSVLENEEVSELFVDDDKNAYGSNANTSAETPSNVATEAEFKNAVFMGDSLIVGLGNNISSITTYASTGDSVNKELINIIKM